MTHSYWFTPKTYGYGAAPKGWQGWASTAAYILAMLALSWFLLGPSGTPPTAARLGLWITSIDALTAGFVWLARTKTEGDWHWRWGKREK